MLVPSPFQQEFPNRKVTQPMQFFVGVMNPDGPEIVVNVGPEQLELLNKLITSLTKPGDTLPTIITKKI